MDTSPPEAREGRPVLPQTLPYHIFDEMRWAIIRGDYPAGSCLREQDVQARFGSSRGPIRESFRLLELRGLVVHSPRRGFRVTSYSQRGLEDLYRLRATVEASVYESMTGCDTTELVPVLEACVRRMAKHFQANRTEQFLEQVIAFLNAVVEASGNRPARRIIGLLNDMSLPARYALHKRRSGMRRAVDFHKKVVRLIKADNWSRVAEMQRDGILESADMLKSVVEFVDPAD